MKPEYISEVDWNLLTKKYSKEELLSKLKENIPVQYLIGEVEFLNTTLYVDKRVLIPRFETEFLVDKTIKYIKKLFNKKVDIIDLGTGSGCIAISLKKNLDANLTAVDISKDALDVAKKNANYNKTKINFLNQDMLENLSQTFDVIISNPPYIPVNGYVEKIVKDNEPSIALFAEDNGLYFYKKILENHLEKVNKPGLIAFEIGDNQKDELEKYLENYQFKYSIENDLQNLPRYLFIFIE